MYPAQTRPTSMATIAAKLIPGRVRLMSAARGVGTGVGQGGDDDEAPVSAGLGVGVIR
jgi:hypothetical protein